MRSADFWAARSCFVKPIAELEHAAELMSQAADAILAGNLSLAQEKALAADNPSVWAYAHGLMGKVDPDLHRWRPIADAAAPIERLPARMPAKSIIGSVYVRDGWRCRFCGSRVFSPDARKLMCATLPDVLIWSGPDKGRHAAFYALSASCDHVVPHSHGGSNDPYNLVTTCQGCNFGRGRWLIEEVGLSDPHQRAPVVDDWDGLTRLLR